MRKYATTGLALLAALLVSAMAVASASAIEPLFLPSSGKLKNSVPAGVEILLRTLSNSTVKCKKVGGEDTVTAGMEGTLSVIFEECESTTFGAGKCTGLSDATTGNITTAGKFFLRRLSPAGTGTVVILFAPNEVHFSCASIIGPVLVVVKGTVACPVTPLTKVKTTENYTIKCEESSTGSGDPKITSVLNLAETSSETVGLLTSTSGGTFESSAQIGTFLAKPSVESQIDD